MTNLDAIIKLIKEEAKVPMSDTKLNFLLYHAHGYALACMGRPLFDAAIFAGEDHPEIVCQYPRSNVDPTVG